MKRGDFFKSDYFKAADVKENPITAKIHSVTSKHFEGDPGPKAVLVFEGLDQMLSLNATNWDTLEAHFGEDSDGWVGKTIELYHDPTVTDKKHKLVGGVRIRIPGTDEMGLLSYTDAQALCIGAGIEQAALIQMLKDNGLSVYNKAKATPLVRKMVAEADENRGGVPDDDEIPF